MSTRTYHAALVGCMLSWFLLGMHTPLLHAITAHHRTPQPAVLAAVAVLAAAAIGSFVALLRSPRRGMV